MRGHPRGRIQGARRVRRRRVCSDRDLPERGDGRPPRSGKGGKEERSEGPFPRERRGVDAGQGERPHPAPELWTGGGGGCDEELQGSGRRRKPNRRESRWKGER